MEAETFTPIVIDLGNKSKSKINKLKRGEGELMDEIEFTYNNVKGQLTDKDDKKQLIPLIVIYREKERQRSTFPFPFPFLKF